nr:MAG TPA: hypothetical protein [Caudoviricetes sp.]
MGRHGASDRQIKDPSDINGFSTVRPVWATDKQIRFEPLSRIPTFRGRYAA